MVSKLWCLTFILSNSWQLLAAADLPTIQLDSVGGQLGFFGDYAGLSPYRDPLQFETLDNSTLITSENLDENLLIFKSFANINGSIGTYCKLTDTQFILAGDFTTINQTTYNHIARLDTQTRQFSTLDQGLDAPVRSLYCTQDTVYVGGDFIAPINANASLYAGHAAIFSNNQWSPVPWKGFNGPVYSIISYTPQNAIIFGGHFNSTGDGQYFNQNYSQLINLDSSVTVSEGNGILGGEYSNPRSLICSQAPWLLQDGLPGYWQAQFIFPIQPSSFRITNAHVDGKNTNIFNIISLLTNEYFQLSYQDPITNQTLTCSQNCPLSNDSSILYQDFTVVNTISTSGIRININSWYGTAGGLGGVSIYKSDTTLQPDIATNSSSVSSSCSASSKMSTPSSIVTTTGTWTEKYSWGIYQTFLISVINANEIHTADVSVTYKPYIPAQGIYNIYATTPGCVGTTTCDQRIQMQLTMELAPGNITTHTLNQNIVSDERTLIYTGIVSGSSDAFQPTIIMKVDPAATTSSSSTVTIVGSSLEFIRNSTGASLSSIMSYIPSNNTWSALSEQVPIGSVVRTLQSNNQDALYIGGQFNINSTFNNVAAYNYTTGKLQAIAQNGLNGAVSTSVLAGSRLFLGGSFNDTAIPQANNALLKHVAIYDTQSNVWSALGEGVNDNVDYLYSTNNNIVHLSGPFTATTNGTKLHNNAEWDVNRQTWIKPTSLILGTIANQVALSDTTTLYLGSIKNAQSYSATNVASLSAQSTLSSSVAMLHSSAASTSNSQASTFSSSSIEQLGPDAVANTGAFWTSPSGTHLILAGSFNINNTKYPLAIYRDNNWQGLLPNTTGNITTLSVIENSLLVGGQFSSVSPNDGSALNSIAFYDLQGQQWRQLTGIFNEQQKPGQVNTIYPQEDGKSVYVGGDFSSAGLLNCNGICMLSMDTRQWTQVNQGLSGTVNDMHINNGVLTVVGSLSVGQQARASLASLDTTSNTASWKAAPSNDQFSNPTSLLYDSDNRYLLAGNSNYIASWDGQSFSAIDTKLDPSSNVGQLSWVPISPDSATSASRYPSDSNTMLMAVGHLVLPGLSSSSSAALYDGTNWHPYLLTASDNGPGRINRLVPASPSCCKPAPNPHHYLSVPAVILISIAISLGIIFLLVACAFIYMACKRRNHPDKYYADPMKDWRPKYRPTSLLAMLDAANLNGDTATATVAPADKKDVATSGYSTALDASGTTHRGKASMDISDAAAVAAATAAAPVATTNSRQRNSSGFSMGAGVPFSVLLANALKANNKGPATEESPKVFYAKYPFEAKEFGELAFDAQTSIVVTDTSDNVWWMGYKDDGNGNPISGLFPSNYVTKARPI